MPSSHLILCHPLLLLPSIPPSIRVFSNESTLCMRWPKVSSFSFSISPSNEHPGLISFRMDWLDLLAVQGTLKSLLQHHSWKASILWHSAFFTVQLSHPCMTTGKTIASTRRTYIINLRTQINSLRRVSLLKAQPWACPLETHINVLVNWVVQLSLLDKGKLLRNGLPLLSVLLLGMFRLPFNFGSEIMVDFSLKA